MPANRFLIASGVIATLAVVVTLWTLPSTSEFSGANPSWNGMRMAREQFGIRAVSSLERLPSQPRGTSLVVIPALPLSPIDLDRLTQYAQRGGVLIVMDNIGFANPLLAHLGIEARLNGKPLMDPLFNFKTPRLPKITDLTGPTANGVASLIFNHPTVISNPAGMAVLGRSSQVSLLDTGEKERYDADTPIGPFTVAASQRIGDGSLVLISDSSLLLNSMLELGDNRRFLHNLFRLAGEGAQIYLDEVHLPREPLDVAKYGLARVRSALGTPLIAMTLAAMGLAMPLVLLMKLPWR